MPNRVLSGCTKYVDCALNLSDIELVNHEKNCCINHKVDSSANQMKMKGNEWDNWNEEDEEFAVKGTLE